MSPALAGGFFTTSATWEVLPQNEWLLMMDSVTMDVEALTDSGSGQVSHQEIKTLKWHFYFLIRIGQVEMAHSIF